MKNSSSVGVVLLCDKDQHYNIIVINTAKYEKRWKDEREEWNGKSEGSESGGRGGEGKTKKLKYPRHGRANTT